MSTRNPVATQGRASSTPALSTVGEVDIPKIDVTDAMVELVFYSSLTFVRKAFAFDGLLTSFLILPELNELDFVLLSRQISDFCFDR